MGNINAGGGGGGGGEVDGRRGRVRVMDENAALLPRVARNGGNDLSQALLLPSDVEVDHPPHPLPHHRSAAVPPAVHQKEEGKEASEEKERGGGGVGEEKTPSTSSTSLSPSLSRPRELRLSLPLSLPSVGGRSERFRSSLPSSSSPFQCVEPLDVWLSIFSCLSQVDLARAATVSHRWATAAYDPLLWTSIHLCHRYHTVDDQLIAALLSSNRFPHLHHLCLDRCSAVTDRSLGYIQAYCRQLHHLSLVHCHRVTREGVLAYIEGSEEVRKVELIGAMGHWEEVVRGIAEMGRDVDLGFFFLEYLAREGVKVKHNRQGEGAITGTGGSGRSSGSRATAQLLEGGEEEEKSQSAVVPSVPTSTAVGPSAAVSSAEAFAVSRASSNAAAAVIAPIAPPLPLPPPPPPLPLAHVVRASCRHSRSVADNPSASACWGSVTGRLVLSSAFYHVPGNYPVHVLYSCEQHSDTDLSDVRFHRCANCEQLFLPSSMYSEVVCHFCYDSENLSRRHNWIPLTLQRIKAFGLSEVVGKTIRIAERKNLPVSLRSFNDSECRLDYTLPRGYNTAGEEEEEDGEEDEHRMDHRQRSRESKEEEKGGGRGGEERKGGEEEEWEGEEREGMDEEPKGSNGRRRRGRRRRSGRSSTRTVSSPSSATATFSLPPLPTASTALLSSPSPPQLDSTRVPLTTFLSHNAARLDRTVDGLQSHLREAYARGCTRALLVLDDKENIEVLADSRVIADGLEGESHLKLVTLLWQKLLVLLYPLLLLFLLSAYYRELFNRLLYNTQRADGTFPRTSYIVEPNFLNSLDLPILSAILGFFFLLLIALVVLFRRYRRYFEVLFRKFLALDIFAIFSFGSLSILVSSAMVARIPLDALTLSLVVLNLSILCVYSLYFDLSTALHTLSVMYLNTIMAVLLSGALDGWMAFWLPFALCLIVAVLDLDLRPNVVRLPPLLVPESMIIPSKPAILLCLNSVYIRPGELTLYGLMVTIVGAFNCLTVMGVLGLWVLLVLLVPFVSGEKRWRRPLPLMLLYCFLLWWQYDKFIGPARFRWNAISWKPID